MIDAFPGLQTPDEKYRRSPLKLGRARGRRLDGTVDGRVGGDKDALSRVAAGAILLRSSLAVSDQGIELVDISLASSLSPVRQKSCHRRGSQTPTDDRAVASVHPAYGLGIAEVARVGFNDQRLWVPPFQPTEQAGLPEKIKTPFQKVNVPGPVQSSDA